ncbi:putative copper-importing P-type ATPase A [mine drainage metagenome]|uniref:Putative copper-importing P-type ATPase A n=1 Tax=mine drainage metagenome TaxID=410659 RepID=A0A1J5QC82_9ZZZZ
MLSAAGALARRGILVRRLDALEALAGIDTVVFDKTGTLTSDVMVLGQIRVRAGLDAQQAVAMASALARHSLHPASRALVEAAGPANNGWLASGVVEHHGLGLSALVYPDGVAGQTLPLRLGSAKFCGVPATDAAVMQVFLSDDKHWLATFELEEDIRADARETVTALKACGLNVCLLSGDVVAAAQRVASRVGIEAFKGQCSPQDKLDFLRDCQLQGHKVAVVGDGLNDGPILAAAHASFAFGQAVPLTQAQADFLVAGSRLTDIAGALLLARRTLAVVRQNLWWAAIYNAVCVPLAVLGMLPAWLAGIGMASSSLLVVLNALRLTQTRPWQREN